jgi:hypothetical protein
VHYRDRSDAETFVPRAATVGADARALVIGEALTWPG